jgi:hypothetical protein
VEVGQALPIDNSTCSKEEQDIVLGTVGDVNVVKTEAMTLSEGYSKSSQNTVKRVVSYAKVRGKYDKEYLYNRTEKMQEVLKERLLDLAEKIPNPDLDFDPVIDEIYESIDEMMSCISPRHPDKSGICKTLEDNLYTLILESFKAWKAALDLYIDRVEDVRDRFIRYKRGVVVAYEISSGFYYGRILNGYCWSTLFCFYISLTKHFSFISCQDGYS